MQVIVLGAHYVPESWLTVVAGSGALRQPECCNYSRFKKNLIDNSQITENNSIRVFLHPICAECGFGAKHRDIYAHKLAEFKLGPALRRGKLQAPLGSRTMHPREAWSAERCCAVDIHKDESCPSIISKCVSVGCFRECEGRFSRTSVCLQYFSISMRTVWAISKHGQSVQNSSLYLFLNDVFCAESFCEPTQLASNTNDRLGELWYIIGQYVIASWIHDSRWAIYKSSICWLTLLIYDGCGVEYRFPSESGAV